MKPFYRTFTLMQAIFIALLVAILNGADHIDPFLITWWRR